MSSTGDSDTGASTPSAARLSAVPALGEQRHARDPGIPIYAEDGAVLPLAGRPGHGRTASLRRQPARIADGRMEGGYADVFELICPSCGDHPYVDYAEVPPRLQQIRGPYTMSQGLAAYAEHLGLPSAPQDQGKRHSSNGAARPLSDPPADAEVLRYRADLASVRSFAAAWAARAGLRPHRVQDLVLAVGELVANTLAHTNEPGLLTLWATSSEVICQVHDTGKITDPLAGKLRPDPGDTAGRRGLWVVHQLCDLVEIRTGPAGTTIRVHLQLGTSLATVTESPSLPHSGPA
jgi:anti-sigma regulatory factor (Ser/Thr protein kinase)